METIELSNSVICTDPCYNVSTWVNKIIFNIKPGTWDVIVEERNIQLWGHRISGLRIKHHKYKSKATNELLFHSIGVDSGQCGFFDLDYFKRHRANEKDTHSWYNRICEKTSAQPFYGTIDNRGVVSESGYGDGLYELYGRRNRKGEIIELRVAFIYEDE